MVLFIYIHSESHSEKHSTYNSTRKIINEVIQLFENYFSLQLIFNIFSPFSHYILYFNIVSFVIPLFFFTSFPLNLPICVPSSFSSSCPLPLIVIIYIYIYLWLYHVYIYIDICISNLLSLCYCYLYVYVYMADNLLRHNQLVCSYLMMTLSSLSHYYLVAFNSFYEWDIMNSPTIHLAYLLLNLFNSCLGVHLGENFWM